MGRVNKKKDRQDRIVDALFGDQKWTITKLCEHIGCSIPTIRNDLKELDMMDIVYDGRENNTKSDSWIGDAFSLIDEGCTTPKSLAEKLGVSYGTALRYLRFYNDRKNQ